MTFIIDIQNACTSAPIVSNAIIEKWANHTLKSETNKAELTIRLVDKAEITSLNKLYRSKDKPTNVLSFPAELPAELKAELALLGDVIICPSVVSEEAIALNKSNDEHFALIVVHGILHLLGFDHIAKNDAEIMQSKEIDLLKSLGYSNPYTED